MKKTFIRSLFTIALLLIVNRSLATEYSDTKNDCSGSISVKNNTVDGKTMNVNDTYTFTLEPADATEFNVMVSSNCVSPTTVYSIIVGDELVNVDGFFSESSFNVKSNKVLVKIKRLIQENIGTKIDISWVTVSGEIKLYDPTINMAEGAITVNPVNENFSYSYLWSNGQRTQSVSNLSPGTYSVIISNGCVNKLEQYSIKSKLSVSTSESNYGGLGVSCFGKRDGWINTMVSGGVAPYSYEWKKNNQPYGGNTSSINNLSAGHYSVNVTDNSGESARIDDIVLNETRTGALSITSSTVTNVSGSEKGKIEISGVQNQVGDVVYSWYNSDEDQINSDNKPNVSNLSEGLYRLVVTDANNCSFESTFAVSNAVADGGIIYQPNAGHICYADISENVVIESSGEVKFANKNNYRTPKNIKGTYVWQYKKGTSWETLKKVTDNMKNDTLSVPVSNLKDKLSADNKIYIRRQTLYDFAVYNYYLQKDEMKKDIYYSNEIEFSMDTVPYAEFNLRGIYTNQIIDNLIDSVKIVGSNNRLEPLNDTYSVAFYGDGIVQYNGVYKWMTTNLSDVVNLSYTVTDKNTGCAFDSEIKAKVISGDVTFFKTNGQQDVNYTTPLNDKIFVCADEQINLKIVGSGKIKGSEIDLFYIKDFNENSKDCYESLDRNDSKEHFSGVDFFSFRPSDCPNLMSSIEKDRPSDLKAKIVVKCRYTYDGKSMYTSGCVFNVVFLDEAITVNERKDVYCPGESIEFRISQTSIAGAEQLFKFNNTSLSKDYILAHSSSDENVSIVTIDMEDFASMDDVVDGEFQYEYKLGGCADLSSYNFKILQKPSIEDNTIRNLYSFSGEPVRLELTGTIGGDFAFNEFKFSGEGITDNIFDPSSVSCPKDTIIRYEVKYPDGGKECTWSGEKNITIEAAAAIWSNNIGVQQSNKDIICKPVDGNDNIYSYSVKTTNKHGIDEMGNGKKGYFVLNDNKIENEGNSNSVNIEYASLQSGVNILKFVYDCEDVEFFVTDTIFLDTYSTLNIKFPNDKNTICKNVDEVEFGAELDGVELGVDKLTFAIGDENLHENKFLPDNYGAYNGYEFKMTYKSEQGCSYTIDTSINIVDANKLIFNLPTIINADSLIDRNLITYVDFLNFDENKFESDFSVGDGGDVSHIESLSDNELKFSDGSYIQKLTVSYKCTDENNCVSVQDVTTTVIKPNGKFDGINDGYYCQSDKIESVKCVVDDVDGNELKIISYYVTYSDNNVSNKYPLEIKNDGTVDLKLSEIVSADFKGEKIELTLSCDYSVTNDKNDVAYFSLSQPINVTVPNNFDLKLKSLCLHNNEPVYSGDNLIENPSSNYTIQWLDSNLDELSEISTEGYTWGDSIIVKCKAVFSEGCSSIKDIKIPIKDSIQPTFVLNDNYCTNSDDVELNISKGDFSINNGVISSESYTFSPSSLGYLSQVAIEYKYNEDGCDFYYSKNIKINKMPTVSFGDLKDNYCDGDTIIINAAFDDNISKLAGTFYINDEEIYQASSSLVLMPKSDNISSDYRYDVTKYSSYKVDFVSDTINGCVSRNSENIKINSLPVLNIVGLSSEICPFDANANANVKEIYGTVNSINEKSSLSVYDGSDMLGYLDPAENGYCKFNALDYADTAQNRLLGIVLNYKDESTGCVSSYEQNVTIYAKAIIRWNDSEPNICLNSDREVFFEPYVKSFNSIKSFKIDYGDGSFDNDTISESASEAYHDGCTLAYSHSYEKTADRKVELKVTDTLECPSYYTETIKFVDKPIANFIWDNECISYNERNNRGEAKINFKNSTITNGTPTYTWNFGNGDYYEDYSSSTDELKQVSFLSAGMKKVKLLAEINNTCKDSIERNVFIRPTYVLKAKELYKADFSDSTHYWEEGANEISNIRTSWTWNGIDTEKNYNMIGWAATGFDTAIIYNESSSITSPCFDFSNLDRPMISMDIYNQTEKDHDGAVLQYSLDNNDNWITVGSTDGGVNWYNSQGISSLPGGSLVGWSGADSTNWYNVRYDLDVVRNKKNVRFRVAYASDGGGAIYDGFAFNNVIIGNRTRRVLIEHFTNTRAHNAEYADNIASSVRLAMPNDAIDIQYHTSSPNGDVFYMANPLAGSIRENYIGVSTVPYSVVDGIDMFDYSGMSVLDTFEVKSRSLYSPAFDIDLSTTFSSQMAVEVKVKSLVDIVDRQLLLFAAIVESEVKNENIVYHNVLREMLPLPSGEYINENWKAGNTQIYKYSYKPEIGVNANNLNVVAFIQDEITGEILQTSTTDTVTVARQYSELGTIEDSHSSLQAQMTIYPNPASDKLNVMFNSPVDGFVEIVNQQGVVVKRIEFGKDSYAITVDITTLPQGLYVIKGITKTGVAISRVVIE